MIDVPVVARATAAALVLSIPLAVIGGIFDLWWIGIILWFAWFCAGGIAAQLKPELPFAHGIVTAIATYVVTQAVGIVFIIARDNELRPLAWAFNATLAAVLGLVGAKYSSWRSNVQ